MKPKFFKIEPSSREDKRLKATFFDEQKNKIKTVHFGSKGASTFLEHRDPKIKSAWIARHQVRGEFQDPMSASALSRWILWNEPTLSSSLKSYEKKFSLNRL